MLIFIRAGIRFPNDRSCHHPQMPQRSPVLVRLLLLATVSVDAVALYLFANSWVTGKDELFLALALGQLSVYCAWCMFRQELVGWRWVVPFAASLLIVPFIVLLIPANHYLEPGLELGLAFVGLFWAHIALAFAALWVIKPSWLARMHREHFNQATRQFSTKNLLAITTFIAVLCVLLAKSSFVKDDLGPIVTLLTVSILLLLATLAIKLTRWHVALRIAAAFGVALLASRIASLLGLHASLYWNLTAFNLIQTMVLLAWFEIGQFAFLTPLPEVVGDAPDEVPSTPNREE